METKSVNIVMATVHLLDAKVNCARVNCKVKDHSARVLLDHYHVPSTLRVKEVVPVI